MNPPPLRQFKRFDVRRLLRQGIEPWLEIHQRVIALPAGADWVVYFSRESV